MRIADSQCVGSLSRRLRAAFLALVVITPLLQFTAPGQVGTADAADPAPWIDTTDRSAVLAAYRAEFERVEPDPGFTGDVATCQASTTSDEFRQSAVQRINWYRRMAGLDVVTDRADYNSGSQQTALMMAAEGSLSHTPGGSWACYTTDGDYTASQSNLALGTVGIEAINAYVRDSSAGKSDMGHRRTLLYPQLREVGIGDIPAGPGNWAANTLRVFDDNIWADRPPVRESEGFVAWPPSGYVPPQVAWGRWTFSLFGADFTDAVVTVRDASGLVETPPVTYLQASTPNGRIAPEPAIIWDVGSSADSDLMPTPTNGDRCYGVTVAGVSVHGSLQPDFVYTTCVIDPTFVAAPDEPPPCTPVAFTSWTTRCWMLGYSDSWFVDVVLAWQRYPVSWLVNNDITTGVSFGRFDPDGPLTRAQAATFIWRLAGSPSPPANAPTFSDVSDGTWYHDPVRWMAEHEITTGTGAGIFSPDRSTTRAEMVTFLWRLVDSPPAAGSVSFADLSADWQVESVDWAADLGITTGTSDTTFEPNRPVTRGEAAALLARFATAIAG